MMYYTHLGFSVLIALLVSDFLPYNKFFFVFFAAIFSLLLDVDKANSKAGKKLGLISKVINFFFGHRKLFHSLLMVAFGYIVLNLISDKIFAVAFLIGTLSHLFLDALTKEGVMLFYPIPWRIKGFVKTNGIIEKMLFLLFLITIFWIEFV